MANHVITGNATSDGRAIYMVSVGDWTDSIEHSKVLGDPESTADMLAKALADEIRVCDPYAIEVEVSDDVIRASSFRESIRAKGPTVAVPGADDGARSSARS